MASATKPTSLSDHPPRVIDVRDAIRAADSLDSVLAHLSGGGLLAYPTETVYGFGGLPTRSVVEGLVALKKRDPAKSMLLLVPNREAVSDLTWTPEAIELADVFWPGSVTLVLSDAEARYPEGVRGPAGGVAVRVSPHPLVRELVCGLGGPILSTSANRPGEPPALDAQGALGAAVAGGAGEELWVLDGGALEPSPPSTIIDCSGPVPVVLRQGTVPLERVRCVLPGIEAGSADERI
ncbi:MAG: L-threonylcarbamoyladenylate synthase [Gemmatimonadetes bacterium]|nr:L-threonylcarbamoyladenylate synthase [Gemmatimonadota bacterium]MCH8810561.1 L-threonylcarbamoyladenylate synthase [Gemmatimonadota bacterium]